MKIEFKMKYIQHWVDSLGRDRYRVRRRGFPYIELPVNSDPASPEFQAAYHAALRGENLKQAIADVTAKGGSGTLADALNQYFNSTTFIDGLSPSTQALRRTLLKGFTKPPIGNVALLDVNASYVKKWIDEAPTFGVKRTRFLAIRPFLKWACEERNLIKANPTDGMKVKGAEEGEGHHTWTDEEIEQYRAAHALGTMARLALELMIAVASRRGDAVALGPQHVKRLHVEGQTVTCLMFTQEKNRKRKPVTVTIPVPAELVAALEACPVPETALTFLRNEYGHPFSKKGFGGWFRKQTDAAGLGEHCVPHGVRKAKARLMAEAGCTTKQQMAVGGWATEKEVARYNKKANDLVLAAQAQAKVAARADAKAAADNVVPMRRA